MYHRCAYALSMCMRCTGAMVKLVGMGESYLAGDKYPVAWKEERRITFEMLEVM